MENNSKPQGNREVDFIYVLKKVIYSWRKILLSGMIFSIIIAAISLFLNIVQSKSSQTLDEDNTQGIYKDEYTLEEIEEIRESLTLEEKTNLLSAETARKNLNLIDIYMKESISYNIDAYNKNVVYMHYYIDLSDYEYIDETQRNVDILSLLDEYCNYVSNSSMTKEIANSLSVDLEAKYIQELLSVTRGTLEDAQIVISVSGKDEAQAHQLADDVKEFLLKAELSFKDKICEHKMVMIGSYDTVIIDNVLLNSQENTKDKYVLISKELRELEDKFNSNQIIVYNYGQESQNDGEQEIQADVAETAINVKYVIIGFILGMMCYVVYKAVAVLVKGKLDTKETIENTYGLSLMADLTRIKESKNPIDKICFNIFEEKYNEMAIRLEYAIVCIESACKKDNISQVLFVSSLKSNEFCKENIDVIMDRLKKSGIECYLEMDINNNVNAIEVMKQIDAVVIVERLDETLCTELEKEISLCRIQQQSVIGAILV